jgi:hypothetical protein
MALSLFSRPCLARFLMFALAGKLVLLVFANRIDSFYKRHQRAVISPRTDESAHNKGRTACSHTSNPSCWEWLFALQ